MSAASRKANAVLLIDVGGTHVKVLATGQRDEHKILSGSSMTASKMVRDIKRVTKNSEYGLVSIGLPILRREARCAFPSQRLNAFALNSIRVSKSQLLNAKGKTHRCSRLSSARRESETKLLISRLERTGSYLNKREKFVSRLLLAEGPQHGGRYGGGVLLFDSTHHHAQMSG